MPCWSIHLGVSYEVNKELKLDNDLIYFGSILPDLLDRNYSHYYNNHVIDFDNFLNKYSNKLNNPLIVGYYIHLLTDYYFNDFVYSNSFIYKDNKLVGFKLLNGDIVYNTDNKFARDFKQNDFKNYGSYLVNNKLIDYPNNYNKIYNSIKELEFDLDKDIIINKINYFKSNDFLNYNTYNGYKLFDYDTYNNLYNNCIKYILSKLKNIL